jgi:hypothetical protein
MTANSPATATETMVWLDRSARESTGQLFRNTRGTEPSEPMTLLDNEGRLWLSFAIITPAVSTEGARPAQAGLCFFPQGCHENLHLY